MVNPLKILMAAQNEWFIFGLFPVNKVIMKIISLLLFVLSSAGGFLGAQEEQPTKNALIRARGGGIFRGGDL